MSGIGGIFNGNGETVEPAVLLTLAGAIRNRGPDGTHIVHRGQAGLVHSHFWTTQEDHGVVQPLSLGHLWVTADARIDNRTELLPLLKEHIGRETPCDAEIILAAYRKWGEQCPRHLIGDFAFVIWDEAAQRVFCARDPVGIKLLHYSANDDTLVVGSSVGSILSTLDPPPKAHMPFIADLLAGRYERWIHETALKGIFRLPPAHYLVADSHGIALTRYWTFGAGPGFHFKTDEEYISCFRDLFAEAVRARTRAIGPIGLTVSGGLDSSSIACLLHHMILSGEVKEPCRIYSSVFDHTPSVDERSYLDSVLSACPHFSATLIPSDDFWGLRDFAEDEGFPMDDPETEVNRSNVLAPLRTAHQDGCRVMISGYGGDQVMQSDAYYTPFTLTDVGLQRFSSEISHYRQYTPSFLQLCAFSYVTPRIPSAIRNHLRRLIPNPDDNGFLTPLCTNGVSPPDLLSPPRLTTRSSQQIYSSVNNGLNSVYRATFDTYAAYAGIDWRFPFYDCRIIEFMLSVPPRLSFRKGYTRCILRQSMTGLLPETIKMRLTKTHGGDLQDRGMSEKETGRIRSFINNSHAVSLGLVDPEKLSRAWDLYWGRGKTPVRPLVRYLCAEAWLRHNEKVLRDQTDS